MPRGCIASKSFPRRRSVPQPTQRLRLGASSLRSCLCRHTLNFNHDLNSCYQRAANLHIRLSICCRNRTLKPHASSAQFASQNRPQPTQRLRLGASSLRSYLCRHTLNFNHNLNSCHQRAANLHIRLSICCRNRTLKPHASSAQFASQNRPCFSTKNALN
jgi:hypothetical protein